MLLGCEQPFLWGERCVISQKTAAKETTVRFVHKKRSKMRPILGRIGGSRVWRYAFLAPICIMIAFSIKMLYESDKSSLFDTAAKESRNRNNAYMESYVPTPNFSSVTLFVRMAGKLKQHRTRFY